MKKLVHFMEKVKDEIMTDLEETLSTLNTIAAFGDCDNVDVIKWF